METDFGHRMAKRRLELGMTQSELARHLGITPQYISITEQGKRNPSITILAALIKELGVSADYLVTGQKQRVPDIIPLIKADPSLSSEVKKALITTIELARKQNR